MQAEESGVQIKIIYIFFFLMVSVIKTYSYPGHIVKFCQIIRNECEHVGETKTSKQKTTNQRNQTKSD